MMPKVGEYLRTKDGYIRKVIQVNQKGTYEALCYGAYSVDKTYKNSVGISAKKVKKHSKDIIDLIEVGDYVNGYPISKIIDIYLAETGLKKIQFVWGDEDFVSELFENQIKSIVTKEQFEEMEYKI